MMAEESSDQQGYQQYYQAVDDWSAMLAEILQILHRGDLRWSGWQPDDWRSHAADLVGRYRRGEEWKTFI